VNPAARRRTSAQRGGSRESDRGIDEARNFMRLA
jgi:hypothetical protein